MSRRHKKQSRLKGNQGFALIIAITLLAFLVLLIVGLASLTKIETSVSDNTSKQAQARQNALMGLNIALGQLQKYAGLDTRVTATGDSIASATNPHYTGVWFTSEAPSPIPKTWLVSGNEGANPLAVTPLSASGDSTVSVELVGQSTSDQSDAVTAPLVKIYANDVPGQSTAVTIGHYAWWVGDQGVKASLGLPDRLNAVTYAPWDSVVRRNRVRLQLASTPNNFSASQGFDPRDISDDRLRSVLDYDQLSLVVNGNDEALRQYLHDKWFDFTDVSMSVLSDPQTGDLMKDLSVAPANLGAAFVKYSDYTSYMESPNDGAGAVPSISDGDSPRRRYQMVGPISGADDTSAIRTTFSVAPVIADFLLQFGLERPAANEVNVKARIYVGLWNPYSSGLIPPNSSASLVLEVSGLPTITPSNSSGETGTPIDLQTNAPDLIRDGNVLSFNLAFDPSVSSGSDSDKASWLPGRYYFWTTQTGSDASRDLRFYSKNLNASGWDYAPTSLLGNKTDKVIGVSAPEAENIVVTLKQGDVILTSYTLPPYYEVEQTPSSSASWRMGYSFRIFQPSALDASREWLSQYDPRSSPIPTNAFEGFNPILDANDPSAYISSGAPTTSSGLDQFLIFRTGGSSTSAVSSNNDVPLFELPRSPILSVGELQHLQVASGRPFSIGNSWGGEANLVFDGYFFSGLASSADKPDMQKGEPLPNWNLIPVRSGSVSDPVTITTLLDGTANEGYTSRYLLQAGGFNVNSIRPQAWRAILSGLRVKSDEAFQVAKIDNATGSQDGSNLESVTFDQNTAELGPGHEQGVFARFPQSAQEVYSADGDVHAQLLDTESFRLGVRGVNSSISNINSAHNYHYMTTVQLDVLSSEIAQSISKRQSSKGPYHSLKEFLTETVNSSGQSALEEAIAKAGVNADEIADSVAKVNASTGLFSAPGFSSSTLTQADLISGIAPYLKVRSDTFIIRTYGDTSVPGIDEVKSQVWLEAKVQRVPETFNVDDNLVHPNSTGHGRKLKIISIRWLSHSDI